MQMQDINGNQWFPYSGVINTSISENNYLFGVSVGTAISFTNLQLVIAKAPGRPAITPDTIYASADIFKK